MLFRSHACGFPTNQQLDDLSTGHKSESGQIISVDQLNNEASEMVIKMDNVINAGLFTGKTVNQTIMEALKRPMPKQLWFELWHEGELCILYADANLGKSIYSV